MARGLRWRWGARALSLQTVVQLFCVLGTGVVLLTGFYPLLRLTVSVEREMQASLLAGFAERVELTLGMLGLDVRSEDPEVQAQVWPFFDHPLMGQSGYPMLIFPSGRIAYHFFRAGGQLPPEVVARMANSPDRRGVMHLVLPGGDDEVRDLGFFYSDRLECYVAMEGDPDEVSQGVHTLNMYGWLIAFLWILCSVGFGAWIGSRVRRTVDVLERQLLALSRGATPAPTPPRGLREVRRLIMLLNRIATGQGAQAEYARAIGRAGAEAEYTLLGPDDMLGKALMEMRSNMLANEQIVQARKQEEELRSWRNQGLAEFGRVLREKSGNAVELADELLQQLVKYLDALQGGFFIMETREGESVLHLIAAFAYGRKKFMERDILLGEGIVGTCAVERDTVHLDSLPEGYCDIVSGVGQMPAREVLAVPLKTDEALVGVIELVSAQPFTAHAVEFVQDLSRSIASTLLTVQSNHRTAMLLEQAQLQREQMRSQEEEMRQNLEEMQATQEEMARRRAESEALRGAVSGGMLYGEMSEKGVLRACNRRLNQMLTDMGYADIDAIDWLIQFGTPEEGDGRPVSLGSLWPHVLAGDDVVCDFSWAPPSGVACRAKLSFSASFDEDHRLMMVYVIGTRIV